MFAPLGFVPDVETQTWSYVYPDLGGGRLASYDDTAFGVDLPATVVYPVTIAVRLRYQTTSREYVEFLRDENRTSTRGQHAATPARSSAPERRTSARTVTVS